MNQRNQLKCCFVRDWQYILAVLVISSLFACPLDAQSQSRELYRIHFTDKGNEPFRPGSELYQATLQRFNPKAIERRKAAGKNPILDWADMPVNDGYVTALDVVGVKPILTLRWTNCVLAELSPLQVTVLSQVGFVRSIEKVREVHYRPLSMTDDCSPARPGASSDAHSLLNTMPILHSGITGNSVRLGLIDTGFRYRAMSSLRHLRVVGEFDYIQNDSVVDNNNTDTSGQDGHGSIVLSIAGGWLQDTLIGFAPNADYILAKTENLRYERRIEEEAYCAAIEWMEMEGAQIISSSLGYYSFDTTEQPMDPVMFDGRTTWAAQYVNRAAELGVLTVTAAGNNGAGEQSLLTPADADSVIAVGAVDYSGVVWDQSSSGLTYDKRVKPDVACMGQSVQCQDRDGSTKRVSGTSMATPQIAGSLALLCELYPMSTASIVKHILFSTCWTKPENGRKTGKGIPDVTLAARRLGAVYGSGYGKPVAIRQGDSIIVLVAIFDTSQVDAGITITTALGLRTFTGYRIDSLWYGFSIPLQDAGTDTIAVRFSAAVGKRISYLPDPNGFVRLPSAANHIPCGVRLPGSIVSVQSDILEQSRITLYPNPVQHGETLTITGIRRPRSLQIVCVGTGTIVHSESTPTELHQHKLQVPELDPGLYLVVIYTESDITTLPVIIL